MSFHRKENHVISFGSLVGSYAIDCLIEKVIVLPVTWNDKGMVNFRAIGICYMREYFIFLNFLSSIDDPF